MIEDKENKDMVWKATPLIDWFNDRINKFCIEHYSKGCDKFRTYTDNEPYWIIWVIQIPYSTVVCFETYRDKDDNGALSVNSNWVLKYWRITRKRFVAVN